MVERHVSFNVAVADVDKFREFFERKYLPAMSKSEGFVSGRLLRPSDRDGVILMLLQFVDSEGSRRWRESDAHASLQLELASLHQGMEFEGYEDL